MTMRSIPWLLSTAALLSVLGAAPAAAQSYPWCAQYMGGNGGGVTNCGFVSYEQCMATARGNGAYCEQNSEYRPRALPPQPRPRKASRPRYD
jgi:hypothetical protein